MVFIELPGSNLILGGHLEGVLLVLLEVGHEIAGAVAVNLGVNVIFPLVRVALPVAEDVARHGGVPVRDGPVDVELAGGHRHDVVNLDLGHVQHQGLHDGSVRVVSILAVTQICSIVIVIQVQDLEKGLDLLVRLVVHRDLVLVGVLLDHRPGLEPGDGGEWLSLKLTRDLQR